MPTMAEGLRRMLRQLAVESGITTLEGEFLANILLPNGGTVGQWLAPQIDEADATGRMPQMLGGEP